MSAERQAEIVAAAQKLSRETDISAATATAIVIAARREAQTEQLLRALGALEDQIEIWGQGD